MKQQTFNLFDEEIKEEMIDNNFDINLDTEELSDIDQTLQIAANDTGELEEIDFDDQFETVNFNTQINEDKESLEAMINSIPALEPTVNQIAESQEETIAVDKIVDEVVGQLDTELETAQTISFDKELDTQDLYDMASQAPTSVTSDAIETTVSDFKTLDTVQFSQELGEVTIVDEEDHGVVEINIETDDFIDSFGENVNFGDLKLMVIGVGGCGCNVVNRMYDQTLNDVKLVAVDTDDGRLSQIKCDEKILVGAELLHGNGSGYNASNPNSNTKVIESFRQEHDRFKQLIAGYHIVFIVGSLSGGTGQVGLLEIGRVAREEKVLSIGFTIAPYRDELSTEQLNTIFTQVTEQIDSTILVDTAAMAASKSGSTLKQANDDVDKALIDGIKGVYEIATRPGFINLDYADICTVFREKGSALMSIGTGRGENNIIDAVNNAIHSYVFEGDAIDQAEYAIIGISAPRQSVKIKKADQAAALVANLGSSENDLLVIFGWIIDDSLDDEVRATVVLTSKEPQVIKDHVMTAVNNDILDIIDNIVDGVDFATNKPSSSSMNFGFDEITPFTDQNKKDQLKVEEKKTNDEKIEKDESVSVISAEEPRADYPDFF